jgi:hypothetical protein
VPSARPRVPALAARRLLVAGLGLAADPARRATPAAVYREIERLGYLQLDTVNVVARAQDHVLYTRFEGYRPPTLVRLAERERRLFEHWTHDASLIPMRWFGHWRLRFLGLRERMDGRPFWRRRLGPQPERLLGRVLERIRDRGAVMSRDFERTGPRERGLWWGGKPEKLALEYLWRAGEITVARRVGFQKVFDLVERVIPGALEAPVPSAAEHVDWACRGALERLGVASPAELAGFFDGIAAADAARWCAARVAAGELREVEVETVDGSRPRRSVAPLDWERRAARAPEPPPGIRLLSPFDPVIRDRARLQRLFGFHYRVEIFVPPAARRFGYFVLPILEGERLVGRLDPRVERERDTLEVRRIWWEPGVRPTRSRRRALEVGLERLAAQLGVARVALPRIRRG